jgi:hypothetical protein
MSSVSVICTVHEEMGLANISELRAILERIQPEVIFLEVPPVAFDDYYENCSRQNLESVAVTQYRQGRQVDLVPVDLPTPTEDFFSDHEYLRRRIREESPEYRRLMKWDSDCVRGYGFAYLNSEHCSELWLNVYQDMASTIKRINDPRLVEICDLWNKTQYRREKEMMESIRKHCRANIFDTGVFLVGAAHRQAVIELSRDESAIDSTKMQWDFAGHLSQHIWELN